MGGSDDKPDTEQITDSIRPFREIYKGTLIAAGGFKAASGGEAIASGHCDLVAYGR